MLVIFFGLDVDGYSDELREKQDIYLKTFDLAEKVGVGFAYPSQSLYIESIPKTS